MTHLHACISGPAKKVKGIGGRYPAFDQKEYTARLASHGEYVCEGNLLWVSDKTTGIPIRNTAVLDAMNLQFPDGPAPVDEMIVIAVPSSSFAPMDHQGALEAVSPEEDRLVVLKAVVRDIADGKKMQQWAAHLSSVPMKFEVLASAKENHFRGVALRERVVSRFNLVARTTYTRMLEVWNFKATYEAQQGGTKLSAQKLADMYPGLINHK